MKVLAITCYTGGEELCAMTERCIAALQECGPPGVELHVRAVAQGASRLVDGTLLTIHENKGFAWGMNQAIESGLQFVKDPDYVLCFNNDLEFPDGKWLQLLLEAARSDRITVPATDKTALHKQPGPLDKPSFDAQESSAYCWLVPFAWCKHLKESRGWWLFDEAFGPCFAEDNKTAFLLAKQFGPKVFRIVPRSFVRHLRHKTTGVVKHDRRASSRLLRDFFRSELKDQKLRPDLRRWAERYVKVLKT